MAMADAIDGDWCAPDRLERVSIEGPKITISPGTEVTGTYTRHEFFYQVPDGQPDAGLQVFTRQLSEEDVEVLADLPDPSFQCDLSGLAGLAVVT